MIRYVEPPARKKEARLLDEYFRLRKTVFCDRFGWVGAMPDGREIDEFDAPYNVYVLNIDERSGDLAGGARLMPTTAPTLLHSEWSHLLPDPREYRADDLWEVTRFCVDDRLESRKLHLVNKATVELAFGLMRFAAEKGVGRLIGICELSFLNMAGAFGEEPEIIATHIDPRGLAYGCGIFTVDPEMKFMPWASRIVKPPAVMET
jgi:N-acyl-L-homoserine lactone synthetase